MKTCTSRDALILIFLAASNFRFFSYLFVSLQRDRISKLSGCTMPLYCDTGVQLYCILLAKRGHMLFNDK